MHDGDYKKLKCESATHGSARLVHCNGDFAPKHGEIRRGDSVELVVAEGDIRIFKVKAYNASDGVLDVECTTCEGDALKNADDLWMIGHTVDDYKQIDTDALLAVVTRAVQDISQELAEVKAELQALKERSST